MNTFHLKRHILGRQPSVQLSKDEFDDLLAAHRRIRDHLAVEELFDVLMRNYEEFERELLSLALRSGTFMGAFEDWIEAIDAVQLVGRRLSNLLTTTHAYCDQIPHSLSALFGRSSGELAQVREYFREEHSGSFGYRVCTELRKYAQHRGTPVHQLNRHMSWISRPDGSRVHVHWIVPQVSVSRLRDDATLKSGVLADLEVGATDTAAGNRFQDLRPYVRNYISCLGRIHLKVRALVRTSIAKADTTIVGAIDRFVASCGPEVSGLSVVELNDRMLIEDRHPTFIMREPIERRIALERRNHSPTRLDTQVVTNEII